MALWDSSTIGLTIQIVSVPFLYLAPQVDQKFRESGTMASWSVLCPSA